MLRGILCQHPLSHAGSIPVAQPYGHTGTGAHGHTRTVYVVAPRVSFTCRKHLSYYPLIGAARTFVLRVDWLKVGWALLQRLAGETRYSATIELNRPVYKPGLYEIRIKMPNTEFRHAA
jgi:hypothetical protein